MADLLELASREIHPPARRGLLREARVAVELAWLAATWFRLPREPRGDGRPVLLLPGLGANDQVMRPLGRFFERLGYRAYGWGLGRNRGNVPKLLPRVVERAEAVAAEAGEPLRLVGWSLGGYLAREVARERPELVERVITLASPVVGGPKYTVLADRYRRRGWDPDAIEAEVAARDAVPITVPVTALYSRRDGIVAWRACVDISTPGVVHLEVDATHLGMGFNPEVYRLLARALA